MAALKLAIPGYVAAIAFFWLWLGAREDLASEIEAANTRTVEAVAEAEREARQAEREAAQAEIERKERIVAAFQKARQADSEALEQLHRGNQSLQEALTEAQARTANVTEIGPDACLRVDVAPGPYGRVRD